MVVHKRKKVVKYRGSKTHGGGSMKKRRGAGNRGGRGMAGTGKRAQTKKPSILEEYGGSYLGKHGFKRPKKVVAEQKGVNIGFLEKKLDMLIKRGKVKKEGGAYIIHLKDIGKNKLLGSGEAKNKWLITADMASGSAVEKVKAKGGSVSCAEEESEAVEEAAEE